MCAVEHFQINQNKTHVISEPNLMSYMDAFEIEICNAIH